MRLHFRPFLGLTVFTVVSLIILIGLGTWQYQRLQWKTDFLAQVEQAVSAPPLTSLAQVEQALEDGTPVDFSRIEIDAKPLAGQTPYLIYARVKRELSWRPYVAIQSGESVIFAAMKSVPDNIRDDMAKVTAEPVSLAGYIRVWRKRVRGVPESTPDKNRWFGFNPLPDTHNWADNVPGGADMRYYIDVVPGVTQAAELPLKRPNIRNNHLDYMLTWYGLALALLVIYLILHAQRGRLGLRS